MNAPSFKHLVQTKELKRADALKAKIQDIFEKPGFNWREEGEDLNKSIADLADFIAQGGQVPDLEVATRAEGGVEVVDGHRRRRAFLLLAETNPAALAAYADKDGQIWLSIKPFTGTDAERQARVMTSQEGRKLTPVEIAKGYERFTLPPLNLGPEDIAKLVHKTRQHVDQMLILAKAGKGVHDLVTGGQVSATTAVNVARKEGGQAESILASAAASSEKGKVTGAAMKPWTPPAKSLPELVSILDDLAAKTPKASRVQLAELEVAQKLEGGQVLVPAGVLFDLLRVQEELEYLRDKAETARKAKEQAAKNKADIWALVKEPI